MPTVVVPSAWAERGPNRFSITGRTVDEVMRQLAKDNPALGTRILDPEGRINRYLSVYLNQDRVMPAEIGDMAVLDVDTVLVVPPMAGG